jgi:hypothetical protein
VPKPLKKSSTPSSRRNASRSAVIDVFPPVVVRSCPGEPVTAWQNMQFALRKRRFLESKALPGRAPLAFRPRHTKLDWMVKAAQFGDFVPRALGLFSGRAQAPLESRLAAVLIPVTPCLRLPLPASNRRFLIDSGRRTNAELTYWKQSATCFSNRQENTDIVNRPATPPATPQDRCIAVRGN